MDTSPDHITPCSRMHMRGSNSDLPKKTPAYLALLGCNCKWRWQLVQHQTLLRKSCMEAKVKLPSPGADLAVLKWSGQEVGVVGCGFSIIAEN